MSIMSSSSFLLVLLCLFLYVPLFVSITSPRPLLQVTKDAKTLQYLTQIDQRTPLVPIKLTVDLGGPYMWVNCDQGYTSSTYLPACCGSAPCRLLNTTLCAIQTSCEPPVPGCYNNTCQHIPHNPLTTLGSLGQLRSDVLKIHSTNGENVLSELTLPHFYFICGSNFINDRLASGVTGMAGLGRVKASLPSQLSTYFRFDNIFVVCLSSSTRSRGAVFFGDGPYTLLPNVDVSSLLTYTRLIVNNFTEIGLVSWDASAKYFIGVKSIKIDGKLVKGVNETSLSLKSIGPGGTTISTVDPYTVMESSIYKAVVAAFVKAMPKNVEKVPNVAPFGACFSSKNIGSTHVGPDVPSIDLVLDSKNVWRINGANSMVEVNKNVLCLGFVEAPKDFAPSFSVVIVGHQIEDNLLQFDLVKSRLGFSSSLLERSTSCANINYTSAS